MKLTIKELAPYLPYGIPAILSQKGIFNQDDEYPNPRTKELGIVKNISFWEPEITGQLHISDTYSFDFDEIDEICICLRPLSDLTKKIEVNGKKFEPIEWFEIGDDENNSLEYDNGNIKLIRSLEYLSKKGIVNDINYLPFGVIQKLFEWHFDVFGLIDAGLAIDINTLNK